MRLLGIAFASFSSGTYSQMKRKVLPDQYFRFGRVDVPPTINNIYPAFSRRLQCGVFCLWHRRSWPGWCIPVVGGTRSGRPSRSGDVFGHAACHPPHILLPPPTLLGILVFSSAARIRRPPESASGTRSSLHPARSIRGPGRRGRRGSFVWTQIRRAPFSRRQMAARQASPSEVHAPLV